MTVTAGGEPSDAMDRSAEPVHFVWLRALEREIQDDYQRLHQEAVADPQRAGHGGEMTWVRLLQSWLPPAYEVATRKYIVPEEGSETFETDIVAFHPSYPTALRPREQVLAGGVAAAFSVKLTLNAAGIRDAYSRAARLRRALKQRYGSPRNQMLGAFPVGLLAHSHVWKQPSSNPLENVSRHCWDLDHELSMHPRETLDLLCIADLTTWSTMRIPFIPAHLAATDPGATRSQQQRGYAITATTVNDPTMSPTPVGSLIANLLDRLSHTDPTIKPMADSLRLTGTLGQGEGPQRRWELHEVFTDDIIVELPQRGLQRGGDWATGF